MQGACVNDTIVDSQLPRVCRRSPSKSNFRLPEGVKPIVFDDDNGDEPQQGFELPTLESFQFNTLVRVTGDDLGVGRPDQQEPEAAEGGQSHSAYGTVDQKQSGGGNSERA